MLADLSNVPESAYYLRMTADEHVGREVHTLMWQRRMTNRAIAARLGMDESTFARKLRGNRKWALGEVLEVAGILGVPVADLLPHLGSNQEPADLLPAHVTTLRIAS